MFIRILLHQFQWIVGKVFMPLAWTMGVEWEDCDEVGELVGIKTIVNEFVAYSKLQEFEGRISVMILLLLLTNFSFIFDKYRPDSRVRK